MRFPTACVSAMRSKVRDPAPLSSGGVIRVWTIQRAAVWEFLQKRGILRGDGRRVFHHFRPAYRWLMAQMRQRLPEYHGGVPIWLWYSPRPDLRRGAHLPPGERGVRIELELPRDRVLLLDFETWHCVLNRWHLSRSWRESREWDRKTKAFDPFRAPLPATLETELQLSWERVFDLDLLRSARMWGPVDRIQAATEYVQLDEVRCVTEFVSR
jgi:hypothetical protein